MPDLLREDTWASSPAQPDPAAWLRELRGLHERLKPLVPSRDTWSNVGAYLVGLLSGVERKNSWQLAEEIGAANPYAFQHLLGRANWDADRVRDEVRAYALEHLGDASGVFVLDETGFVKKGTQSVGVKRQYTGTAGRIENAQVGVFLVYASNKGAALIDRALYLPEEWANDPERRRKARIPESVTFATKSEQGRQMLERALAAGAPAGWVTGDENYGKSVDLRRWLEAQGCPYVLAVASNTSCGIAIGRISEVLEDVNEDDWFRWSAGEGEKGLRLYDWACMTLNPHTPSSWHRWVLFRRRISDGKIDYYVAAGPKETPVEELVRVAGMRWAIESCFELAKGEVGLDQYEVRNWVGWHRHITLSMAALAFLTVIRTRELSQKGALPIEGRRGDRMSAFKQYRKAAELERTGTQQG